LDSSKTILLVGLGNPGPRYALTRHNAGFIVLDLIAKQEGAEFRSSQFNGDITKFRLFDHNFIAFKPMSFMNLSGGPVTQLARYNKIGPEAVVALYDDIDVPLGKVKTREAGGHGGHNGIRSLIDNLGTDAFARIKLGVGRPDDGFQGDVKDWVLNNFSQTELRLLVEQMYPEALERLRSLLKKSGKPA
jgi:PTH1 family peptidyl-tRNA hydrolase